MHYLAQEDKYELLLQTRKHNKEQDCSECVREERQELEESVGLLEDLLQKVLPHIRCDTEEQKMLIKEINKAIKE